MSLSHHSILHFEAKAYGILRHGLESEVRIGRGGRAEQRWELSEEREEEENEEGSNLDPDGARCSLLTSSLPLLARSSTSRRHVHASGTEELEAASAEGAPASKLCASELTEHPREDLLGRELFSSKSTASAAKPTASSKSAPSSSATGIGITASLIVDRALIAVAQHLERF